MFRSIVYGGIGTLFGLGCGFGWLAIIPMAVAVVVSLIQVEHIRLLIAATVAAMAGFYGLVFVGGHSPHFYTIITLVLAAAVCLYEYFDLQQTPSTLRA